MLLSEHFLCSLALLKHTSLWFCLTALSSLQGSDFSLSLKLQSQEVGLNFTSYLTTSKLISFSLYILSSGLIQLSHSLCPSSVPASTKLQYCLSFTTDDPFLRNETELQQDQHQYNEKYISSSSKPQVCQKLSRFRSFGYICHICVFVSLQLSILSFSFSLSFLK